MEDQPCAIVCCEFLSSPLGLDCRKSLSGCYLDLARSC